MIHSKKYTYFKEILYFMFNILCSKIKLYAGIKSLLDNIFKIDKYVYVYTTPRPTVYFASSIIS